MKIIRAALAAASLTLAASALSLAPAAADTAKDEQRSADLSVRQTIEAQLAAFREGDAEAAYALAAPGVKRIYRTPERFVSMVRRGYAPVYYAKDPVFLRAQRVGDTGYAQEVGLSGPDGRDWTALYTLSRQNDGSWRITGCYLKKAVGQNI